MRSRTNQVLARWVGLAAVLIATMGAPAFHVAVHSAAQCTQSAVTWTAAGGTDAGAFTKEALPHSDCPVCKFLSGYNMPAFALQPAGTQSPLLGELPTAHVPALLERVLGVPLGFRAPPF